MTGVRCRPGAPATVARDRFHRIADRRKIDAGLVERVIFAVVAQRARWPASKLDATKWVTQRVFIEGVAEFGDDAVYRRWASSSTPWPRSPVRCSPAHLRNLDLDLILVYTTSTYWQVETADDLAKVAALAGDDDTTAGEASGTKGPRMN